MLYSDLNLTRMVDGFSAMKNAGETEKHSVRVDVFDKNVFYAIVAVDKDGNVGQVSNVKEVRRKCSSVLEQSRPARI
jgi:hypothetical protein